MKTRDELIKLKMEYRNNDTIKNLLMGIIADCDRVTTHPTPQQIQDVLKATLKSNKKMLDELEGSKLPYEIIRLNMENEFIEKYLPKKLSEDDIKNIIEECKGNQGFKTMGEYMKYFKEVYPDQYDGKMLSTIVKESLC